MRGVEHQFERDESLGCVASAASAGVQRASSSRCAEAARIRPPGRRNAALRADAEDARSQLPIVRTIGTAAARVPDHARVRAAHTASRDSSRFPRAGEVTYLWGLGPDEVAMRTVFGKEMPGHCALYFSPRQATRRLSCLRLTTAKELGKPEATVVRFGPPPIEPDAMQRLFCTCAPVRDYTGQEVARVGVFGHGGSDAPILTEHHRGRVGSGATDFGRARLSSVSGASRRRRDED